MLRRLLLGAILAALFLPLGNGCNTNQPVIWSWPHNKRRLMTIADGFHELHMDIDRIIFNMDERPIETEY